MIRHLKIQHFQRDERGTTAVEFSLLAVPFMLFAIGIIELSLLFVGSALLQGGVSDAARLIRTGQLQQTTEDDPQDLFEDALCDAAGALLDCDDFQYDVQPLDSFSDADTEPEFDEDGNLMEQGFDPGESSDVVLIRVTYRYPLMTPGIGASFSDLPNNSRLLMATIVMETEPYDFDGED